MLERRRSASAIATAEEERAGISPGSVCCRTGRLAETGYAQVIAAGPHGRRMGCWRLTGEN